MHTGLCYRQPELQAATNTRRGSSRFLAVFRTDLFRPAALLAGRRFLRQPDHQCPTGDKLSNWEGKGPYLSPTARDDSGDHRLHGGSLIPRYEAAS